MSPRLIAAVLLLAVVVTMLPGCAHREPTTASPAKIEEPEPEPEPAPDPRILEEDVHTETTRENLDEAERLLEIVGERKLNDAQREQLVTIRSLLNQSREALATGEPTRANNLADKGLILVRELEAASRP